MLPYDCACVDYNWIANCCQVVLSASLKNRFLLIYSCTWLRCKISDGFFFSPVIVGPYRFRPVMHTELSEMNSARPLPRSVEFLNTSSLESLLSLLFVPVHFPQSICIFIPCVHDCRRNLFLWHLDPWFLLKDSPHHCSAFLTVHFCTSVNAVGSCDISFKTFYNTASCSSKTVQEMLSQWTFFWSLFYFPGHISTHKSFYDLYVSVN